LNQEDGDNIEKTTTANVPVSANNLATSLQGKSAHISSDQTNEKI